MLCRFFFFRARTGITLTVPGTTRTDRSHQRSLMQNSAQRLKLYRTLLKVARSWPAPADREGRSLKPILLQNIKQKFRANKAIKDGKEIQQLTEEARKELFALQQLKDDALSKKVSK